MTARASQRSPAVPRGRSNAGLQARVQAASVRAGCCRAPRCARSTTAADGAEPDAARGWPGSDSMGPWAGSGAKRRSQPTGELAVGRRHRRILAGATTPSARSYID